MNVWITVRRIARIVRIAGAMPAAGAFRAKLGSARQKLQGWDCAGAQAEALTALELAVRSAENSQALLLLDDAVMAADDAARVREAYGNVAAWSGAVDRYQTDAALWIAYAFAEEGSAVPGSDSGDPFGLPHESQQTQFGAGSGAYPKAYPEATFALGVETPARKVFRDKLGLRGEYTDRVSPSTARNEDEAFQLCVAGLRVIDPEPIGGVKLSASGLAGPGVAKIPAADSKIWQVGYIRTGRRLLELSISRTAELSDSAAVPLAKKEWEARGAEIRRTKKCLAG